MPPQNVCSLHYLSCNLFLAAHIFSYAVDDYEDEIGLPPPRLFCDICDVFDEHDTDDCPLQATTSDSPPNSMYHGDRAPGGSDRPYCNTCESESQNYRIHWVSGNVMFKQLKIHLEMDFPMHYVHMLYMFIFLLYCYFFL